MSDKRQALLEAALHVIRSGGAAQLTLERVAQEAGVSKGGLLYHFPSKEALLQALLGHFVAQIGAKLDAYVGEGGTGAFARAYIRTTLEPQDDINHLTPAILAAMAHQPSLLQPLRAQFEAWQARAEADGLPPGVGTLVRLAMDGLWFADLFDLAPPDLALREHVSRLLQDFIPQLTKVTHRTP
jgi:AcrR family transcriptional regulator